MATEYKFLLIIYILLKFFCSENILILVYVTHFFKQIQYSFIIRID